MSIDVAGSADAFVVSEGVRYARRETSPVSYEAPPARSRLVTRRDASGRVVVRDFATGVEATGATYLDALWAFQKTRRQRF